jgi:hypothetical protein
LIGTWTTIVAAAPVGAAALIMRAGTGARVIIARVVTPRRTTGGELIVSAAWTPAWCFVPSAAILRTTGRRFTALK